MGETRETGDTGESRAVDGRDKGDRGHWREMGETGDTGESRAVDGRDKGDRGHWREQGSRWERQGRQGTRREQGSATNEHSICIVGQEDVVCAWIVCELPWARHTCPQGWVPRVLLRRVVLCGGVCFVFVPFGVCNGGGGGGGGVYETGYKGH